MSIRWAAVSGYFKFDDHAVRFLGSSQDYGSGPGAAVGTALSDQVFSGGVVSADITFTEISDKSVCDLVIWYHPERRFFVSAGLANAAPYGIRHFDGRFTEHAAVGNAGILEANRRYHVEVRLRGSRVSLAVDGVNVAAATLPFSLPPSQVGIWCRDYHDVVIQHFTVQSEEARAFVVMEFKSQFEELHQDVVKLICREFNLEATTAAEAYGPGLVIADIERQIDEAKLVIAEITPPNPNVYYEVGYARAKNKPTILLADRRLEQLPFDVAPFRVLFYENTIGGKKKVEEGLRRHITAILNQSSF